MTEETSWRTVHPLVKGGFFVYNSSNDTDQ